MMTSKDLIARFTAEARQFKRLALVVLVEDEARLMWSDGPNLLLRLNSYIDAGGLPIGTIGYVDAPDRFQVSVKVLEELADIPLIKKSLTALLDRIQEEWVRSHSVKNLPAEIASKSLTVDDTGMPHHKHPN
jgi:hypothetical protein